MKKKLTLDKLAYNQLRNDKQVLKALRRFAPLCEHHKTPTMLVEDSNGAAWIYVCVDCAAEKKLGVTTITRQYILDVLRRLEGDNAPGQNHQDAAAGGPEVVSGADQSGADV